MHLQGRVGWRRAASAHLSKRAFTGTNYAIIAVFGALVLIIVASGTFLCYRKRKTPANGQKPETSPQSFISRLFPRHGGRYQQTSGGDEGPRGHAMSRTGGAQGGRNGTAAIDRNTSIRSVITLPAYRPAASHEERVLGREGERDGVDVIVDMPTGDDEEAMREAEMNTLYQIRVARRQELAEREARRNARREAQARHDQAALDALRSRPTLDANRETIRELREEVDRIKETRQRSVSSVSYADLGVARHDGSRLRANSNESERIGLLSDAASIAASTRPGATSPQPSHFRGRSASSIVSIDSDTATSPGFTRSGANTPRASIAGGRAGSSPELVEADLGTEAMPPPEYEDVPLDGDELGRASPFDRSTTPMHEPPPDYPGPYRTDSQRSDYTAHRSVNDDLHRSGSGSDSDSQRSGRGVGGTPQLPSLRIARLPSIVIEPSSAIPRDDDH